MASASSTMLTTSAAAVHTVGQSRVSPSVYFSPMAQPTSKSPAITSISQLMHTLLLRGCRQGMPAAAACQGLLPPPRPDDRMAGMPPDNVILVGFMGVGKSTGGRLLARRLGRCFVETDDMIEIGRASCRE